MNEIDVVALMLEKAREHDLEDEVQLAYEGYLAAGDPPRVAARFAMIDFEL